MEIIFFPWKLLIRVKALNKSECQWKWKSINHHLDWSLTTGFIFTICENYWHSSPRAPWVTVKGWCKGEILPLLFNIIRIWFAWHTLDWNLIWSVKNVVHNWYEICVDQVMWTSCRRTVQLFYLTVLLCLKVSDSQKITLTSGMHARKPWPYDLHNSKTNTKQYFQPYNDMKYPTFYICPYAQVARNKMAKLNISDDEMEILAINDVWWPSYKGNISYRNDNSTRSVQSILKESNLTYRALIESLSATCQDILQYYCENYKWAKISQMSTHHCHSNNQFCSRCYSPDNLNRNLSFCEEFTFDLAIDGYRCLMVNNRTLPIEGTHVHNGLSFMLKGICRLDIL